MVYCRGHKKDYDTWRDLGNTGWGYDDVLPYFTKSENNKNPAYLKTPYHKSGGLLSVTDSPYLTPLATSFLEAGVELGYQVNDLNGENGTGFMLAQATIGDGKRCSTGRAFLVPARTRLNLDIVLFSHVTKILIDPLTKVAFGVEFVNDDKMYTIRATKEVILSAGTIRSPQVLMLSGIGPSDELSKHEIPLIQDLPVGENYHDHIAHNGLTFSIRDPNYIIDINKIQVSDILDYAVKDDGVLSSLIPITLALIKSKFVSETDDLPDIQLTFTCASRAPQNTYGLKDDFINTVYADVGDKNMFSILTTLVHPKSIGTIKLNTTNPFDYPIIDGRYLEDERDIGPLVEGLRITLNLLKTRKLQDLGVELIAYKYPACSNIEELSDAYLECMIREYTVVYLHGLGTCKMGPQNDGTSVVDPKLKVFGITGLRVIDASIMPTSPSCNINAPTIMIGEKGADLVKLDWQSESF